MRRSCWLADAHQNLDFVGLLHEMLLAHHAVVAVVMLVMLLIESCDSSDRSVHGRIRILAVINWIHGIITMRSAHCS